MTDRIVQLLPADGWHAAYTYDDGEPHCKPLVAWALVEDTDGNQRVQGLWEDGQRPELVDDHRNREYESNFITYIPCHIDQLPDDKATPITTWARDKARRKEQARHARSHPGGTV